jgi:hypothetical protein
MVLTDAICWVNDYVSDCLHNSKAAHERGKRKETNMASYIYHFDDSLRGFPTPLGPVHSTGNPVDCTKHNVQYTMYNVQSTKYILQDEALWLGLHLWWCHHLWCHTMPICNSVYPTVDLGGMLTYCIAGLKSLATDPQSYFGNAWEMYMGNLHVTTIHKFEATHC